MESVCKYNATGMILCAEQKCKRCGWNPEVAEKRLERIRKELAEKHERVRA